MLPPLDFLTWQETIRCRTVSSKQKRERKEPCDFAQMFWVWSSSYGGRGRGVLFTCEKRTNNPRSSIWNMATHCDDLQGRLVFHAANADALSTQLNECPFHLANIPPAVLNW